jgi:hypothetical protein
MTTRILLLDKNNDAHRAFSVVVYKNLLTLMNWRLYLTCP